MLLDTFLILVIWCFSLFKHNHLIDTSVLCDGLYVETVSTIHHNVDTKRSLVNERSVFLWYKCLGYIYREIMEILINNRILPNLNFLDLNTCVDFIKGK